MSNDEWIYDKIERATAAHHTAPGSDEHDFVWCGECWAEDHPDAALAPDDAAAPGGAS